MIETLMIFALGFLAATLLSLVIIPALNARAERLARRRVEALFPLSIEELTAEKDHLRAEFAVLQRRMERKTDDALAARQADMEELGRRLLRIEVLEGTVSERDASIGTLEADVEQTRERMRSADEDLTAARASLATTRDALGALERAHRATLEELDATRRSLETTTASLAQSRADFDATRNRLLTRDAEHADLLSRHQHAMAEIDAKRIEISDLETRLLTQLSRGDDFEQALGARRSELSAERQRLADLAKGLVAEQERSLSLEQRLRALQADRDARAAEAARATADLADLRTNRTKILTTLDERTAALQQVQQALGTAQARVLEMSRRNGNGGAADWGDQRAELRSMSQRLEVHRAEKTALEGALAAARDERARLERALALQRREADVGNERVLAENAELRRRIDEVADQILRASDEEQRDDAVSDEAPRGKRRSRRSAATA